MTFTFKVADAPENLPEVRRSDWVDKANEVYEVEAARGIKEETAKETARTVAAYYVFVERDMAESLTYLALV